VPFRTTAVVIGRSVEGKVVDRAAEQAHDLSVLASLSAREMTPSA
jgi:hypothetical protein